MTRDLSIEPLFAVEDVQGDILVGLIKKAERLIFFKIEDVEKFKLFVKVLDLTSMKDCLAQLALIQTRKAAGLMSLVPTPGLNIAFTAKGLSMLDVEGFEGASLDLAFKAGMANRTNEIGDPNPKTWTILKPEVAVHGVFIVTGASRAEIANLVSSRLAPVPGHGWVSLHEEVGSVRPEPVKGHEHFGFADGVSQPGIRGCILPSVPLTPGTSPDENQGNPGQDLLWPGEFVFGQPGQIHKEGQKFFVKGDLKAAPITFMENGAYLVIRRLAQKVPEFNAAVSAAAAKTTGSPDPASTDLLGAQMVGRWKSGAPMIIAPTADNPTFAEDMPLTNDFEYGDDREGKSCPWAAHIRKVYPRNDVPKNVKPTDDEVDDAEAFTQTHRMVRRGIAFGPELTEQEAETGKSSSKHERGLLFKCYVTSLVDQFEFVQKNWANAVDFSQKGAGLDPIIGQGGGTSRPFLGAVPFSGDTTKKHSFSFRTFVEMQGGEYFFAPSISAIRSL